MISVRQRFHDDILCVFYFNYVLVWSEAFVCALVRSLQDILSRLDTDWFLIVYAVIKVQVLRNLTLVCIKIKHAQLINYTG